jgi:threonine dehydrogenase-like Zn-dependent dehydrogenase
MAASRAGESTAGEVFAIDLLPERLELARRFGARPIDATSEDPREVLREATEGRGADCVLEAVGSDETSRLAVELVRTGGTVSAVGVHCSDRFPFSPVMAYDKNLTYRIGRAPARHYLKRMLSFAATTDHDLAAVISHRLPLKEGPRGYEIFARREEGCTKVVLIP